MNHQVILPQLLPDVLLYLDPVSWKKAAVTCHLWRDMVRADRHKLAKDVYDDEWNFKRVFDDYYSGHYLNVLHESVMAYGAKEEFMAGEAMDFMWSDNPALSTKEMNDCGHSGTSMSWTIWNLHKAYGMGWREFVDMKKNAGNG